MPISGILRLFLIFFHFFARFRLIIRKFSAGGCFALDARDWQAAFSRNENEVEKQQSAYKKARTAYPGTLPPHPKIE